MNKWTFKFLGSVLFSALFFNLASAQKSDADYIKMVERIYDDFETISTQQAVKLLGKDQVYFLDVRETNEFKVSHIRGALLMGAKTIDWKKLDQIPKNATIIVYCSVGARSQDFGKKIKEKGYQNVKNLYGGLFLWANEGREMVDSNGVKTDRIHGYSKLWGRWIKKGTVVYDK